MRQIVKTSTAVVGLLAGTWFYALENAKAADLGSDCCADLEERVAELEATAVRKGNRKVSLQISGHVGHQIMWWDDGTQKDMYIGDGGNIFSRWRLRGDAKISAHLTAGFTYEFGINNNAIGSMNQLNGGDDLGGSAAPELRDSTVWLRHKQFGMLKIGHGSTATDNLILIDLGGMSSAGTPDAALYVGSLILRTSGGLLANGVSNTAAWAQAIRGHESFDTTRRNHILYETPSLAGFTLQAAVAEDNYWDIALRYAGEFGGFRIAGGIGYQQDTEFNNTPQLFNQAGQLCTAHCDLKSTDIKGSLSILHVPTGLFVTGAGGKRDLEGGGPRPLVGGGPPFDFTTNPTPDLNWWYLAAGVSNNYFGIGRTVLFGEYAQYKGGLAQAQFVANTGGCQPLTGSIRHSCTDDSKVTQWGLGITQHIDAAAMELFATYKQFSLDATGFAGGNAGLNNGGAADLKVFMVGTRINF